MDKHSLYGTQAWVEAIAKHELPALAATVKVLEKIAKDEKSSLSLLGQSVLHDHGLTSRILRVVNSVAYRRGGGQITTVSRAAVVLGYDQLKHICITARMIDGLLDTKNITESVYQRVLKMMACSLQAAMLSKLLLSDYAEDTQEEVYIAALLHNLGEVAFWSQGGELTAKLDKQLNAHPEAAQQMIKELLGTTFDRISIGLASSWNMGKMLVKSLDEPDSRSPELRVIHLAHRYSQALVEQDAALRQQVLKEIATLVDKPLPLVKEQVANCVEQTRALARSYGASVLSPYLQIQPQQAAQESVEEEPVITRQQLEIELLRELTVLITEQADVNVLVHTAMEAIQRGVAMDRVIVLMVNQRHDQLSPRFVTSPQAEQDKHYFKVMLGQEDNLFEQVYRQHSFHFVDDQSKAKYQHLCSATVKQVTSKRPFFLAPLTMDERCIAMIYADREPSAESLTEQDFASFSQFVRQTNLGMAVLLKHGL